MQDAAQAWIGLSSFVDRRFESQLTVGNICTVADSNNPAVRFKSDDTTGSYANAAETMQNITVDKHAYVGFLVEDFAAVQSKYDVRSDKTTKATYSLMSVMEGDATSGLHSCPDNFSQSDGALGSDPTSDNVIRCLQYLDDADVPEEGRFFWMSPATHAAMLKQEVFTSGDYGATGAIKTGRVKGDVYGFATGVSTLCSNNPSTASQSYSWICGKQGVALIVQRDITPHAQWENLEIGWGVVVDMMYGFIERLILPKTLGSVTPSDIFNCALKGP
jgi:hypothetical protein